MKLLFIQPLHGLLSFLGFKRQAASKSPVIRETTLSGTVDENHWLSRSWPNSRREVARHGRLGDDGRIGTFHMNRSL